MRMRTTRVHTNTNRVLNVQALLNSLLHVQIIHGNLRVTINRPFLLPCTNHRQMAAPVDCNDRYILMKDTPGEEKSVSSSIVSVIKKPFVGGNSSRQIMVLRGELLGQIPPSQQQPRSDGLAHNYFVDKDPSTTLFVVDEQGISPLSLEEYRLLRAIDSCYDRFTVFVNGDWLEWGVKLNVGDQVYVRLPGPNPTTADWSLGFVRCKGNVHSLPGTNFGVEIYVS